MKKKDVVTIIDFIGVAKKEMSKKSYLSIKHILREEFGIIVDEHLGDTKGIKGKFSD